MCQDLQGEHWSCRGAGVLTHRIPAWSGLAGPSVGHPEQAAQDLVQAGLEYLQRRRLHSPSGQPVLVLAALGGEGETEFRKKNGA